MNKRLLLLRHAKSSWDDPDLADFDRPLAPRGEKAAPFMARYMADAGLVPDRILCSSAARTRATLAHLLPAFGAEMDVLVTRALYEAPPETVIRAVRRHGGDADVLLVVGHNPGLEEAAVRLAGAGRDTDLEAMGQHFPTAALAVIDFPVTGWSEIAAGAGHLERFVRPRALMDKKKAAAGP